MTDSGSNDITAIDTDTNTVKSVPGQNQGTEIPAGHEPFAIALTPDGKMAYVCNTFNDAVTPVNLVTGVDEAPITVGNQPITIAIVGPKTPTITSLLSPSQPDAVNSWYVHPVTLVLNTKNSNFPTVYSTDAGATWNTYNGPVVFKQDGQYAITYGWEDAGGSVHDTKTLSFNLDQTPTITQATTPGQQGNNGWYVGPVQVNLSPYDAPSGISTTYYSTDGGTTWQTYTSSISFPSDGKYSVEYYSVDNAGNKETPQSVRFNIDQTPPTIKITSPTNSGYLDAQSLTAEYSVTDNMSGADSSSFAATLDGQSISNGNSVALYTLGLGSHTLTVTAEDTAGNKSTQSVTFEDNTSTDSIENLVSQFTSDGAIDNEGISKALTAKLDSDTLEAFVNQVKAQTGKHIDASVAKYLIRDANFLIGQ